MPSPNHQITRKFLIYISFMLYDYYFFFSFCFVLSRSTAFFSRWPFQKPVAPGVLYVFPCPVWLLLPCKTQQTLHLKSMGHFYFFSFNIKISGDFYLLVFIRKTWRNSSIFHLLEVKNFIFTFEMQKFKKKMFLCSAAYEKISLQTMCSFHLFIRTILEIIFCSIDQVLPSEILIILY